MENGDGRPPSSARHPCRPGKDLKGEITGEGTLIPTANPKGTKGQPPRSGPRAGDLPLGRARVGLADGAQQTRGERACAAALSQGTLQSPGRVRFLDFSSQSLEMG